MGSRYEGYKLNGMR